MTWSAGATACPEVHHRNILASIWNFEYTWEFFTDVLSPWSNDSSAWNHLKNQGILGKKNIISYWYFGNLKHMICMFLQEFWNCELARLRFVSREWALQGGRAEARNHSWQTSTLPIQRRIAPWCRRPHRTSWWRPSSSLPRLRFLGFFIWSSQAWDRSQQFLAW